MGNSLDKSWRGVSAAELWDFPGLGLVDGMLAGEGGGTCFVEGGVARGGAFFWVGREVRGGEEGQRERGLARGKGKRTKEGKGGEGRGKKEGGKGKREVMYPMLERRGVLLEVFFCDLLSARDVVLQARLLEGGIFWGGVEVCDWAWWFLEILFFFVMLVLVRFAPQLMQC